MNDIRSVLDALKESPLAQCFTHSSPWQNSGNYAAFECAKGCLWSYADPKLTVEYLDGLNGLK